VASCRVDPACGRRFAPQVDVLFVQCIVPCFAQSPPPSSPPELTSVSPRGSAACRSPCPGFDCGHPACTSMCLRTIRADPQRLSLSLYRGSQSYEVFLFPCSYVPYGSASRPAPGSQSPAPRGEHIQSSTPPASLRTLHSWPCLSLPCTMDKFRALAMALTN
jgi:hypothetical protein